MQADLLLCHKERRTTFSGGCGWALSVLLLGTMAREVPSTPGPVEFELGSRKIPGAHAEPVYL